MPFNSFLNDPIVFFLINFDKKKFWSGSGLSPICSGSPSVDASTHGMPLLVPNVDSTATRQSGHKSRRRSRDRSGSLSDSKSNRDHHHHHREKDRSKLKKKKKAKKHHREGEEEEQQRHRSRSDRKDTGNGHEENGDENGKFADGPPTLELMGPASPVHAGPRIEV